ncbi:MAG: glycosyltransferase family 1 protein [Candidatus Omnitrophota bacterium]
MDIGINASYLELTRAGVARFIVNLLKTWPAIYPNHRFHLYFRKSIPNDDFLNNKNFVKKLVACPSLLNKASVWENFYLPQTVAREKSIDVFFSPSYTLPMFLRCKKKVVTIFDISYISHPEWYPRNIRWHYNIPTFFTARNADMIVTSSNFSKQEIVSYLKVDEKKVQVVYLAADKEFRLASDPELAAKIKKKFTKGRNYLFFLGLLIQRRNITPLLKAFKKNLAEDPLRCALLLAGANRTYPYIDINKAIKTLGLEKDVFWHSYIEDADLPAIYNGAKAFIYPSSYEGFGIPPLEAMSSGVPVITAGLSSLPEVVGDAAYLLKDPGNVDEMAEAMKNVLNDKILRATMIENGLRQAKKFSWQETACKTMKILSEI